MKRLIYAMERMPICSHYPDFGTVHTNLEALLQHSIVRQFILLDDSHPAK